MRMRVMGAVTLLGLGYAALAVGQAQTDAAQTRHDANVSLTGCVARGPDGQFHLSETRVTGDRTANTSRPPDGLAWSLTGNPDLTAHLGERVEVSGQAEWDPELAGKLAGSAPRAPAVSHESSAVVASPDSGVTALSESAFVLRVASSRATGQRCQ